jgi:DNA-binding response OmpR family regulator
MANAETILLVEDDALVLDGLMDVVQRSNYVALTATNGLEAVAVLEDSSPDLIIADVVMPRMNGYQLYHRVRSNPVWRFIPFIFLSAKGESEDVRYGNEVGADDYLKKSIDVDDLMATIMGNWNDTDRSSRGWSSPHTRKAAGNIASAASWWSTFPAIKC